MPAYLNMTHPSQLTEYGGACEVPLGESPFEKQLLEIVETGLEEHEMTWFNKDPADPSGPSQQQQQPKPALQAAQAAQAVAAAEAEE